ncbi:hypothetical protein SPRG_01928 [Saprolegnia parasitica CBS 223.65]|uniref:Uncharacterized protein n=1 Tax=Saprolegnia parasitica (strain CBS 223.65) TaxID=695850 RepID=A0A067D300_SAPPC|nr:hypothetical protein SPRG_01928 [Saprolegnia parasitica CBS 223.65]KDO33116.1 hypothetical protein SPRG_01928 [Saprolegnia parasitica CBS 223.65]|eukprot:XP_012195883.1 hypothetical protein SPRG_01928 [Saprolegnia parasitica CBS 223.65]
MSPKKRRYVGNANAKKRQEVEGTFGTQLQCRRAAGHPQQTLPSPERPPPLLRPSSPEAVNSPRVQPPQRIQDLLVQNILRHQHETKTFKTESWYESPAGYGAISNAIIAALSIKDNARTGYVSIDDIVDTFTKMNFGLKEDQVRQLFRDNNAEPVHYKTFAKQFDLPPSVSEDPIARQERTVALLQERIKEPSRVPVPSSMSRRKKPINVSVLEEITPAPPTLPPITVTTTVTKVNTREKTAFNINHLAEEGKLPSQRATRPSLRTASFRRQRPRSCSVAICGTRQRAFAARASCPK